MIIFDLDGTLADCSHRLPMIAGDGPKDWDSFHQACVLDVPIKPTIDILNILVRFNRVEIWTCRNISAQARTIHWLHTHRIFGISNLKMRSENDRRTDVEIKEQWLRESIYTPVAAFEDRKRVVDMYRRNGVMCYSVADGDY